MNKRILELYKQAQEFAYKNISKEYWNTDNFHAVVSGKQEATQFRFAELIVAECMKLNSKELSITAIERLLPLYEEHFGVEL